ncbi:MAG TPA: aldo/keto reductase [Acetobacteraceae bacterium]|nr:aldo/keto reductase [Acetobacteraceae bacterium]
MTDPITAAFGPQRIPVSRLGFGGAPAGLSNYLGAYDAAAAANREAMIAALRHAVELGVSYFDTAPGYGDGLAEAIFGEALEGETVFLATKVPLAAAGRLRQSLEASLRRLRRDRVDLLQLHGSSYGVDAADAVLRPGGMLEELLRLKEEGLIGLTGFTSEDNNAAVFRFIDSGGFDVMQICYNLLHQHPYDPTRPFGSLIEAKRRGMATVTMRTATSGTLQRWLRMVNPADTFDYTPALIQFVLSNPLVDVALVGMRDADEVAANVRLWHDVDGRIDVAALHARYA